MHCPETIRSKSPPVPTPALKPPQPSMQYHYRLEIPFSVRVSLVDNRMPRKQPIQVLIPLFKHLQASFRGEHLDGIPALEYLERSLPRKKVRCRTGQASRPGRRSKSVIVRRRRLATADAERPRYGFEPSGGGPFLGFVPGFFRWSCRIWERQPFR